MTHYLIYIWSVLLLAACVGGNQQNSGNGNSSQAKVKAETARQRPVFVADSAYQAVADQLAFGPRVPGSEAHRNCALWLSSKLESYGAKTDVQETQATTYNGLKIPVYNICGSFNTEAKHRVLLMAHWDSRPMADHDPDPALRNNPVDAANDGASGVGILLEIARLASIQQPHCGIDILLCDAEDYGAPDSWTGRHSEDDWALGTQLWCQAQRDKGYSATYGILLDMVGAADASFYREYYSDYYASDVVDLVWQTAANLGYKNLFIGRRGPAITDDHTFVNRILGIPTIDIIDTRNDGDGTFYPYWHTTGDTLDKISKETLQRVGDVLVKLMF